MKTAYAVYYADDYECVHPINTFDRTYLVIRDGCYIFYQSRSDSPDAAYPVNSFFVLRVAQ